jgi:spore coat protein U-like protein
MFYRAKLLIGLLIFFVCQNTFAGTASGTLAVTATVGGTPGTCVLASVTPMVFLNYNPLDSHPDDATALMTVTCNRGVPYDIGMNEGDGIGATEEERVMTEMSAGSGLLPYGIYKNSNRTHNWGDTIGEDTMHMVGNNLPQRIMVYGKITGGHIIEPGIYMDKVTVIVTF